VASKDVGQRPVERLVKEVEVADDREDGKWAQWKADGVIGEDLKNEEDRWNL